jgi:hypothetical protein
MLLKPVWKRLFSSAPVRRRRPAAPRFAVERLEARQLLAAGNYTILKSGTTFTVNATDNNNSGLKITRSGSNIVFTALTNTQLTYGTSVATTQTIAVGTTGAIAGLTINLGQGISKVDLEGISTVSDVKIQGAALGQTEVFVHGTPYNSSLTTQPTTIIGGSLIVDFLGSAGTLNLYGSTTGGGAMAVTGSVSVTANGTGTKQVNVAGPLANNPTGGKLTIGGGLGFVDQGQGVSGLRIDAGVTITGSVAYDNSLNTSTSSSFQLYSNSVSYGATSIGGTLDVKLASSLYSGNQVTLDAVGTTPLTVTGAASIASGNAADNLFIGNTLFRSTLALGMGSSPAFVNDVASINGSTFTQGVTLTSTGPRARLNLGTLLNNPTTGQVYSPTTFSSTFSAYLTGDTSSIYLSNSSATTSRVIFNSNLSFIGGSPAGTYYILGPITYTSTKFTKTNFSTTAPAAVAPNVRATLIGSDLTLAATNNWNPNYTVTRSGTRVVITGLNGTTISYGTSTAASQSILINSLASLTLNLGTGINTVLVDGLAMTGNLTVNGGASGRNLIDINANSRFTTIGGSIVGNLGNTESTLNIYSAGNTSNTLTVTGSVQVTGSGDARQQVNLAGPLGSNPLLAPLYVRGNVAVTDTGNGPSGLHIDAGVTITGNVAYDNSLNTIGGSKFELLSNSNQYGVTSVGGLVNLKTSVSPYVADTVEFAGVGSTPLTVNSSTTITTGMGPDRVLLTRLWSKGTAAIDIGNSAPFQFDQAEINGSRFDASFGFTSSGVGAQLNLGTRANDRFGNALAATAFNRTFSALMAGGNSVIQASFASATQTMVTFASNITLTGGNPAGLFRYWRGTVSYNSSLVSRTNFTMQDMTV